MLAQFHIRRGLSAWSRIGFGSIQRMKTKRRNVRPRRTPDPIGITVRRSERGWVENDRCVALFGLTAEAAHFRKHQVFGEARHQLPAAANLLAERQGFEPWVPVKAQRFSRPPRSTAPAPLLRQPRITQVREITNSRLNCAPWPIYKRKRHPHRCALGPRYRRRSSAQEHSSNLQTHVAKQ